MLSKILHRWHISWGKLSSASNTYYMYWHNLPYFSILKPNNSNWLLLIFVDLIAKFGANLEAKGFNLARSTNHFFSLGTCTSIHYWDNYQSVENCSLWKAALCVKIDKKEKRRKAFAAFGMYPCILLTFPFLFSRNILWSFTINHCIKKV